ncbi:MAG: DUF349 domain-containing protein [Cryomorphaceae bacterium]|nr:MAG: DUF349 domain-containing protein [Cryomorphaceae bacterium]
MSEKKGKIIVNIRENFQKKTKLIESLKNLNISKVKIEEKENIFNSIRRKWVSIGKVPSHQSFNLNNSYKHQIKLYYDLVYLNNDFKEKNLYKNLIEKKELINNLKKLIDYGNKVKAYKDSLKIIKRWNFLTGPTKQNHEINLNKEFDDCVKKIKESKKDYLSNKEKYNKQSIENKKRLIDNMRSICDEECTDKISWIRKIKFYEKSKEKFINIGPLEDFENEGLWKEFKEINKKLLIEKNSFFKNLKKEYSNNLKKQNELIENLKDSQKKEKVFANKDLQELKKKFNNIKNVPFRRNKENRNIFFDLLNYFYKKTGDNHSEKKEAEKKNFERIDDIINEIKENLSKQNIDDEIEKLSEIDVSIPIKQLNELSDSLGKKFKDVGHLQSNIDSNILKIKSVLMSEKDKTLAKIKIKNKINEIKKQIGQLENNLTFIKSDTADSIFNNVHNQIKKFNNDLILQKKKLNHFI